MTAATFHAPSIVSYPLGSNQNRKNYFRESLFSWIQTKYHINSQNFPPGHQSLSQVMCWNLPLRGNQLITLSTWALSDLCFSRAVAFLMSFSVDSHCAASWASSSLNAILFNDPRNASLCLSYVCARWVCEASRPSLKMSFYHLKPERQCDKGRMQQESEKTSILGEAQRTAPPSFPSMHSLSARGFVLICKDS